MRLVLADFGKLRTRRSAKANPTLTPVNQHLNPHEQAASLEILGF